MSTCYDCGRNECDCQDQRLAAARAEGVREGREWAVTWLEERAEYHRGIEPTLCAALLVGANSMRRALAALAPNTEETERHGK